MRFSFLFKCGAGLLPANHCGLSPRNMARTPGATPPSIFRFGYVRIVFLVSPTNARRAILQWQNDQGAIPHPGQCQTSVGVDIQNPAMRRAPRVTWERKSAIGSPSPNPLLIFIA